MANELWRRDSNRQYEHFEGSDYSSVQHSLRARRPLTRPSNQNEVSPRWDWGSAPAAASDGGEDEPAQELRCSTLPMSLKRAMRQVQKMRVPVVSSQQSWRRKKARTLRRIRETVQQSLHFFTLWGRTLQKIGGNFGGGVQSFFLFLRFLVLLNLVTSLLIAAFVLVPSIIFRSSSSSASASTSTSVLVNSSLNVSGLAECLKYDPNPPSLVAFYNYFLDLLSGTGFMAFTYLFYGYYDSMMVVEDSTISYSIPLAYIFTIAFYFVFCFIGIVARMGATAQVVVATGGSAARNYSMKVFTGWDYGSTDQTATILKQKNIHYQLQVDLEEQRLKEKAAALTLGQKVVLYSLRVLMFLLSLTLIGVALYCIVLASNFRQENNNQSGFLGLIYEYLPSIVITAGNFVVPMLGDQIALVERYSPSTTIILALLRSVVLYLVSLAVLILTLWQQITCQGDINSENCKLCQYNHQLYPCWETRIGQEMYKLTLFDLLINMAVLVLVEFPRRMLVDNVSNKLVQSFGRQEFVVPSNVLGLVYGQTVVWMGALFCPLLPLINVAKFIILFYIKKTTLFNNCRPARKTFRSTSSTFFFLVVLLCGWGMALAVMVYSMSEIRPSMSCGPFRFFPFMWAIVPNFFYSLSLSSQEFLFFIGSQAFSIPLFLLFSIMLCYFIALASVYGNSVALLRQQLKMEGRDKHFLVKQIGMLNKQVSDDSAEEEDYVS